jgi:hypothetical protein
LRRATCKVSHSRCRFALQGGKERKEAEKGTLNPEQIELCMFLHIYSQRRKVTVFIGIGLGFHGRRRMKKQ